MDKDFGLSVRPEIIELAKSVIGDEEMIIANKLSACFFVDEQKRECAIGNLQSIIGSKPKRPVYYLNYEIGYLPEDTRNVVRYAGDFVDQIVKHCAYEKGRFLLKTNFRALRKSLGPNLKNLKGVLPEDLINKLTKFNDLIYVQAKHSWDVGSRPHLFSAAEAVLVCFMVKKFAGDLAPFSLEVQLYLDNKVYEYHNTDPA